MTPAAIEQLLQSKAGSFAPGTINHVRSYLVRAFSKAKRAVGGWGRTRPRRSKRARCRKRSSASSRLGRSSRSSRRSSSTSGRRSRPRSSPACARARSAGCRSPTSTSRAAPHGAPQLRAAVPEEQEAACRAHPRGAGPVPDLRTRGVARGVALPGRRWDAADEVLAAGGHPAPHAQARRDRHRLQTRLPSEGVRPPRGALGLGAAHVPEVLDEALADRAGPVHPLSRHEAHVRESAPHVRREPRLGAAATRPLGPADHRAPIPAPLAGLHAGRGEPPPIRHRPARAAARARAAAPERRRRGGLWHDFTSRGRCSHAVWCAGGAKRGGAKEEAGTPRISPSAGTGPCRSPIPEQADHRFRSKPITDSGACRSLYASAGDRR